MPIKIKSKKAGFRRAGMAHPAEWIEHPDGTFTDEQLAQIIAEADLPNGVLQVEIITAEKSEGTEENLKKDDKTSTSKPSKKKE